MRTTRLVIFAISLLTMLALVACQPVQMMGDDATENVTEGATTETAGAADEDAAPAEDAMMDDGSAVATIATRSLRVRQDPGEDAEVIYGVSEGEEYRVLEISPDGGWVRLAIADAPDGSGWVAAGLVSVLGELDGGAMSEEAAATEEPTAEEPAAEEPEAEATEVAEEEAIAPPAAGMVQIVTDGTRLRVRAEPSTEAEIAGYVYNSEEYEFVGQSDDGVWVQIGGATAEDTDNPDGGWVAAEFVIIGQ